MCARFVHDRRLRVALLGYPAPRGSSARRSWSTRIRPARTTTRTTTLRRRSAPSDELKFGTIGTLSMRALRSRSTGGGCATYHWVLAVRKSIDTPASPSPPSAGVPVCRTRRPRADADPRHPIVRHDRQATAPAARGGHRSRTKARRSRSPPTAPATRSATSPERSSNAAATPAAGAGPPRVRLDRVA